MSERRWPALARALESHREALVYDVASMLSDSLPIVGVPGDAENRAAVYRQQMATTVQRFHDMVQVALTLDWGLVAQEYAWSRRVLGLRGVTWRHQQALIDAYFGAAARQGQWTEDDRTALSEVAARLRATAAAAYGEAT